MAEINLEKNQAEPNMVLMMLTTGERVLGNVSNGDGKDMYIQFPLCLTINRESGKAEFYPMLDTMEMFDADNDWFGINPAHVFSIGTPHPELVSDWQNIKQKMQSNILTPSEEEKKIVLQ